MDMVEFSEKICGAFGIELHDWQREYIRKIEMERKKMKDFSKKDLKEFDVVKLRNGEILMVLRNNSAKEKLAIFRSEGHGCLHYLDDYNDDMTHISNRDEDIIEVAVFDSPYLWGLLEKFFSNDQLTKENIFKNRALCHTWKCPEVEEMTLEEVCKALGKEIKIVTDGKK